MHWVGVDESIGTLLTFENLNIDDEPAPTQPPPQPPTQQPMQPLTQQRSNFARLQRGFLTNNEPRPRNAHDIPLVGLHLRDTTGDPVALAIANAEMRRHFEDLQWHHNPCAD